MKITNIDITQEHINNGLSPVKMKRLNQLVLLAGKNGAGKTRLLNLIIETIQKKPKKKQVESWERQAIQYEKEIERSENKLVELETRIKLEKIPHIINNVQQQIDNTKTTLTNNKTALSTILEQIEWNVIETSELAQSYTIIPFVPKSLDLTDANSYNKTNLQTFASKINNIGVSSLAQGTFARIQVIQDRWHNATHQNSNHTKDEKSQAISEYEKLKDLILVFLNTDIDRDLNGDPTLFDFPLGKSNLSDGQKVLLQLCLAIHCQDEKLENLILFLDEPENHLHPSVIIQTLERLLDKIPNGQLWVSTHSIPLLSYFDPSKIWYIEDNKVSFAGSGSEKVLTGLLGDEDRISKLQDFISLPGLFALHRHAFESLFHPEVVMTDSDDPQTLQIRDELKKHIKNENKIRVLDYGAGKGRLLANIISSTSEPISQFNKRFEYIAYDKFDTDKEECLCNISKYSESTENKYFNSFSDLFSTCDKGSFDIIIMCNVLHEIDPKDWLKLFSQSGDLAEALSENGILLLVEDQVMPIGEKAYEKGFIVLDTSELKDLFKISENDTDFNYSDARGDGRLKAHRIKKEYFTRIDSTSRLKSLEAIHKKSSEEIMATRSKKVDYKNGKIHGFWIQQYANSGLALDELK